MRDLIHNLGLVLDQLDSFMESCDIEQQDLSEFGLTELAGFQAQLKSMHERFDSHKSSVGKLYDALRTSVIPNKMDEDGVDSITVQGVGRVSLTSDIYLQVIDKEASFEWLMESGHGDLISETVNASSLKALLRRMLRDGKEVPESVYKVTPFSRASITKS